GAPALGSSAQLTWKIDLVLVATGPGRPALPFTRESRKLEPLFTPGMQATSPKVPVDGVPPIVSGPAEVPVTAMPVHSAGVSVNLPLPKQPSKFLQVPVPAAVQQPCGTPGPVQSALPP